MARKMGAVNTIDFSSGTPVGYNTDGIGSLKVLKEAVGEIKGKKVLILGAGGAARAISFYLDTEGAMVTIANRTKERAAQFVICSTFFLINENKVVKGESEKRTKNISSFVFFSITQNP